MSGRGRGLVEVGVVGCKNGAWPCRVVGGARPEWAWPARTLADEQADLGIDKLLGAVALAGHQAQHRQEGLDVAQAPLLVLQLLLLGRAVDAGEHVGLGPAEHVEERLVLRAAPQHLGEACTEGRMDGGACGPRA